MAPVWSTLLYSAAVRLLVVLAITLMTATGAAHVGPSKDDNNRYLKLSPQADRVRLAYTVFFGEVPGGKMRSSIDADHDGTISEKEAQAFGDKLADEVADALDLRLDKTQLEIRFEQVVVGMGSPQVRAGSFSVDMIANLCIGPHARHELVLRDRFRLLNPGETEVRIEDARGIALSAVKIGQSKEKQVKYVGPGGPLSDDGVELTFDVTPEAAPPTSVCATTNSVAPDKNIPLVYIIGAGTLVAFILAAIFTLVRRRLARR
jgi:hypothetical protein